MDGLLESVDGSGCGLADPGYNQPGHTAGTQ